MIVFFDDAEIQLKAFKIDLFLSYFYVSPFPPSSFTSVGLICAHLASTGSILDMVLSLSEEMVSP